MGDKKPVITANRVTFVRLFAMPIVAYLLITDMTNRNLWIALVLGTLIGCTDFVDGYLARKHGPTVLGGLLDPIADKVFISFSYIPFVLFDLVPGWMVALLFVREFLVTALRTSYERRDLTMKTSYLSKVKTWTQMQVLAVIILVILVGQTAGFGYAILAGIAVPVVGVAVFWATRKKLWTGACIMAASNVVLYGLYWTRDIPLTLTVAMFVVLVVTWLSGFDYFTSGVKMLRSRGDLDRADYIRYIGAIGLPIICLQLVQQPFSIWVPIVIIATELAIGGLDNLLAHHKVSASALRWGVRVLGTSVLLIIALVIQCVGYSTAAYWLSIVASFWCIAGAIYEFWRGSDYYLDSRLRNQQLV